MRPRSGWAVISMKSDWRRVFAYDPDVVPATR
jgi:hypothetical protein